MSQKCYNGVIGVYLTVVYSILVDSSIYDVCNNARIVHCIFSGNTVSNLKIMVLCFCL